MISSHGSSNSRGVAILFKNGIDCSITHKIVDPEGRYIILKACIQDKDYVLINVYAPNKDKDQVNFFNNLLSILQNENLDSLDNIILGGDLNCPLDPLLDKKGGASTKRKSVISCVDDFKSKLDLVDIWSLATNKWKFYQVRKWMFRKRGNVMLTKTGCNYSTWEKWKRSRSNVDTKIVSKVIAARVKKVLPSIIHYK